MNIRSFKSSIFKPLVRTMLLAGLALMVSACNWTALLSVSSAGDQSNSTSEVSSMSADGRYVAFDSSASNLAAGDTNNTQDVFVRDTVNGTTERVSVDSAGAQGNDRSMMPDISGDGRYVTFSSFASNLVAYDTNNTLDGFVHDRKTGTTTRISVDNVGTEGDDYSIADAISADGRYIVFSSYASNLVADDTNNMPDVFLRDSVSGTTTRVSVDGAGIEGNAGSAEGDISANGRYVTFSSYASNLVDGDTNDMFDVFVYDREPGTITRASGVAGTQGNAESSSPAISADGRYIAFTSFASNLVAGDINSRQDVFVHDRVTGTTNLVSVDRTGATTGNADSGYFPAISGDGRFVTFGSSASNLVVGDTNGTYDIFIHDRTTRTTSRVSLDAVGVEANSWSQIATISADGRYVVFATHATNLVPNDTNGYSDLIIRANPTVTVTAVIPDHLPIGATTSVKVIGSGFLPGATPSLSGARLSNIFIIDENTITMDVTILPNKPQGARNLIVNLYGTGPGVFTGSSGVCNNCVTFQ